MGAATGAATGAGSGAGSAAGVVEEFWIVVGLGASSAPQFGQLVPKECRHSMQPE